MQKYKANSRVLGLRPGDTFESDDSFYEAFTKNGMISKVGADEAPGVVVEVQAVVSEPVETPVEPEQPTEAPKPGDPKAKTPKSS